VRAACGSTEDLSDVPEPVRRAVAWQLNQPHAGPAHLFGDPAPAPMAPMRMPQMVDLYSRAIETPMADGSTYISLDHLPEWQAWTRWLEVAAVARYSTSWAASQWPGDARWVWTAAIHSRRALSWLRDPAEPLTAQALTWVLHETSDKTPERRTLATDILTQLITDGRLTSPALGTALNAPADGADLDPWHTGTAGRLAEALTRAAAESPLHRAVIRRSLTASATVWSTLPARPLCLLLALFDELGTADGHGLDDDEGRAAVTKHATGRSKSAGLARRVLALPTDGSGWPPAAAALALTARIGRAHH
jgi:hypothetical protein